MKQKITASCVISLLAALLLLSACGARDVVTGKRGASSWADDKALVLSIEKEFLTDDLIRFLDFNAYSYGGHVFIVGLYTDRQQTTRATEIAKSFDGVTKVTGYFIPKGDNPSCNAARRIEFGTEIRHKILTDTSMSNIDVTVEILECDVILLGYVNNESEKAKVEAHAHAYVEKGAVKSYLLIRP